MRLLFVSTLFGDDAWGASEHLWSQTATRALDAGHRVFANVKPAAADYVSHLDVTPRVDVWDRGRAGRASRRLGVDRWRVERYLARVRPDVVLLSHGSGYDVLSDPGVIQQTAHWCRKHRVPYVPLVHGLDQSREVNDVGRLIAGGYFSGAAVVLFVSAGNWRAAERQLQRPIKGAVVRNLRPHVASSPWPQAVVPRLACVGRLDVATKGQDLLISALAELRDVPWHLSFYGEGPDLELLRRAAARADLTDRITYAGFQPIETIWGDEQLLALPSRVEGASMALVEAMLSSRPVLATDVGGAAEWIEPGRSGWVVPDASADALTRGLHEALRSARRWPEMGRAASRAAARLVDEDAAGSLLTLLVSLQGQG